MDKEQSILYAKKYLEDILSFFGLNTDVSAGCDEDVIELSVPSTYLNGFLIGQRGDTLRSLQFLVSQALKNGEAELTRVNIDIADYKKQRADRLTAKVGEWIEEVKKTGEPLALRPMNAADRRVVHHVVNEIANLQTSSEGEGRDRHVVISPVKDSEEI
jgi:spoIIIJ-associated protein